MIRRYIVFAGYYYHYHPSGGWNDFKGSFLTIEEAEKLEAEITKPIGDYEWCQIVDTHTLKKNYPILGG